MGTPDFAVPSLDVLLKSKHNVAAVVTGADKERGRGKKISYTPVKSLALQHNIPVLQPEKLKDEAFVNELKNFNADLFVIVAFRILPKEVFTLPSKGSFNLHGSLLPRYRGAAPIQWALINGDPETGLTTFMLDEKVDTGNIILQEKIKIEDEDDFGSLHDRMSELGGELVLKTVNLIEEGNFKLYEQDNILSLPAPKITKEFCEINWRKPAVEIHNFIRGVSPVPGAYFIYNNKIIKIYKTKIIRSLNLKPGEIKQDKKNLYIGCSNNSLEILELQLEGKKRLSIEEFLRGFSFNQK